MKETVKDKKDEHPLQSTIVRMKRFGWDNKTISKIVSVPESIIEKMFSGIKNNQESQMSFVERDFDVTENELESFPNYRFEDVQNERFL
jgi:hypothetical protein